MTSRALASKDPRPSLETFARLPGKVSLHVAFSMLGMVKFYSVCLPVCLSVCLSVRLSVCLSVCLSVRLSVSVCLSGYNHKLWVWLLHLVCLSVRLSECLSICGSVCMFVPSANPVFQCLSVDLSVCVCVCVWRAGGWG
jgi:hypothetical protein